LVKGRPQPISLPTRMWSDCSLVLTGVRSKKL
jgi:hypothetical protein